MRMFIFWPSLTMKDSSPILDTYTLLYSMRDTLSAPNIYHIEEKHANEYNRLVRVIEEHSNTDLSSYIIPNNEFIYREWFAESTYEHPYTGETVHNPAAYESEKTVDKAFFLTKINAFLLRLKLEQSDAKIGFNV